MSEQTKGSEASGYGEAAIEVLEGLEAVRRRPAMFLGNVSDPEALARGLWEIVRGSIPGRVAALSVRVQDARTLRLETSDAPCAADERALEVRCTSLHGRTGDLSILNGLSERFEATVSDGTTEVSYAAARGRTVSTGRAPTRRPPSMSVVARLDLSVVAAPIDTGRLARSAAPHAVTADGLRISILDEDTGRSWEWPARDGLVARVRELAGDPRAEVLVVDEEHEVDGIDELLRAGVALTMRAEGGPHLVEGIVGGRAVPDGAHVDGAHDAVRRAVRAVVGGADPILCREGQWLAGLTMLVAVDCEAMEWLAWRAGRLAIGRVASPVGNTLEQPLVEWLRARPALLEALAARVGGVPVAPM